MRTSVINIGFSLIAYTISATAFIQAGEVPSTEIQPLAYARDIILATPPVWFFHPQLDAFSGKATCTAVNLHRRPVSITVELVFHNDDTLPFPIIPDTLGGEKVTQVLHPGEATAVDGSRSSDALLARCVFKYQGSKGNVKAAIILEDNGSKVITLPAEFVGD